MKNDRKSILVVDDELCIRRILKLFLAKKGFEVDTAENGIEALNMIQSNAYHLIITDLKMPGMTGQEILHYVKSKMKSSVPVLGMSGTPWLLGECMFDDFLPKPFALENSMPIISRLLNQA